MEVIRFHVEGLPPKKNGANSMWGNQHESERLVNLRKAALRAMNGRPTMKSNIRLAISVCVGAKNNRLVGDLDTFITGTCDGLMRRAAGCKLCPSGIWERAENADIHPDNWMAIEDDCQVVSIQADKTTDSAGRQFYDVELESD